jgi:hypothetical protein
MIVMRHTDRYAILARRTNTVTAGLCLNARTADMQRAQSASCSAKNRSAPNLTRSSIPGTADRSCTTQPSAAIKSP